MKKAIPSLFLVVALFFSSYLSAQTIDPVLYVYLKGGKVDAYPSEVLKAKEQTNTGLQLTLNNDSVITYAVSEMDSVGAAPTNFPSFTSFKFNNKYNENVYLDVFATIGQDSVKATVGAIGKRLTPSFRLSTLDAQVFVDGQRQESKVTRQRFDHPITYTVTTPNYRKLDYRKIKDEEWSDPVPGGPIYEDIVLTPEMLSTNAPTNFPDSEDLDKLIDGNTRTFFHSTWGTGVYEKLPIDQHPYLEVALAEAIDEFTFKYTTRGDADNRNPKAFQILGSNDRVIWNEVAYLSEADGMPGWGRAQEYVSPNISCGQYYSYLRFVMTDCAYKNYLALSEFSLHKYLGESAPEDPQLISPAQYDYTWIPFGHDYVVDVNWLADADTARVPRIDINLRDGFLLSDITKQSYLNAQISFDGGNVFPNLVVDTVLIKGRGNISWGHSKKPYRLKFATSVKPFGLTKGKNWVLLANSQGSSMLTNMIGMKIARMVGTAGANDIIPVELYINGEYRGSYNFTQHVGLHNNSVDIDETNAVLLELDSYYDELFKFRDSYYNLPVNIKSPELEDILDVNLRDELQYRIMEDFEGFVHALYYNEEVEKWMSPTMLAKYILVNELAHNTELKHPKSSFLYREDLLALHSKYIFGPVWDLDWGFGYETNYANYSYCTSDPTFDYFGQGLNRGTGGQFFTDLRNVESVRRAYYKEWKSFMELHLTEMQEYLDDYYQFARTSLEHNASLWRDGNGYAEITERFKNWLTARAEHIYANLEVFDLETPVPVEKGDVNLDGYITLADVVCLQNYLFGLENTTFDWYQADANGDGDVTLSDLVWTVALAMNAEVDFARHMTLPRAAATLSMQPFTATLGQASSLPVAMNIVEGQYAATQFDVLLPQGMALEKVELPDSWQGYQVEQSELGEGRYRVAVYTADGTALPQGAAALHLWVKAAQNVAQEGRVVSLDGVTLVTALGEDERLSGKSAQFGMEVTGIEQTEGTEAVRGGDALYVDALMAGEVNVYTVDGRLVKVCPVVAGRNQISLPAGVYIVNQQKVMINQ